MPTKPLWRPPSHRDTKPKHFGHPWSQRGLFQLSTNHRKGPGRTGAAPRSTWSREPPAHMAAGARSCQSWRAARIGPSPLHQSHSQDPKHHSGGSRGHRGGVGDGPALNISIDGLNRRLQSENLQTGASFFFFCHFFSPQFAPQTLPSPPPTGWERGSRGARQLLASPGASAVPTLESHPPSHTDGTRTSLLPNRHCRMRTTKDKIRAGMRGSAAHPFPTDRRSQHSLGTPMAQSPELILSLGVKNENPKWKRNERKELHRPQPNTPTEGPKQRAATKPKQRSKGRRNVAHSLLGLCFARAPGAGLEVQASKRGFRCS